MVKLVVRICMFFIIFGFILSFLDKCTDSVFDRFLDDFLNPTESVKGKDYITNDDIANASPVEYNIYVGIKMSQYNQLYISNNTTNISINQEISPINVLIENCNQSITEQESYVNKSKIDQTILMQWVNENKSSANTLKEKYDILKNRFDNLESEIQKLESDVESLKSAMSSNEKNYYQKYYKNVTNIIDRENYNILQKELNENVDKLLNKIEDLKDEIANNKSLLKDLNESINICIHEINKINEKLDKLIEQSGTVQATEDVNYYYIIDTKDNLKSKGIVSSSLFSSDLTVASNPDKDHFAILTDKNKTITLGRERDSFELLSDMPAKSYEFRTINNKKVLIITDVKSFWSNTKYLIILKSNKQTN